jgi:streptogrisin C
LSAAAQVLVSDAPQLRAAGVDVQRVTVDSAHHRLDVGLKPASNPNSAAIVRQRVRGVAVSISYVRVHAAAAVSEYAPGPPWDAGVELYSTFTQGGRLYYRECTAGFNVVSPSTGRTYLTTAGHCFAPGSVVMHSLRYTGQQVGVVGARAGYGSTADVELIPAASGNVRNSVVINGQRQLPVRAYRPSTPVGTAVCKSGIATAETCGNVVQETSVTVCYPGDGCIYGQEATYNPQLARVASYGDSGGPVYTYGSDGAVVASGIVSGFEERCNGGGCYFDGVMYFTPIKNMKSTLGVVP